MTADTYDYAGYYTIVLSEFIDDYDETITQILKDCWSLYIANAIVLTPSKDYETIFLHTFFPYTPQHCESVKPIVYDRFANESFIRNANIFPDKFRNFHQCPLKISSYNFPPFVIMTKQLSGSYYIDGIEGTIVRVISQRLNFTPIVLLSSLNILRNITNISNTDFLKPKLPRSLDMVSFFHQLYSFHFQQNWDKSTNLFLFKIGDDTANLTMGAIVVANSRAEKYSMTFAHYYSALLFAIPIGRPYSSFEKLFFPFKMRAWVCICILFTIAATVITALKLAPQRKRAFLMGRKNDMPFFNMINICLGVTIPFNGIPVRNFARTILFNWLLFTLVLRNAFQGKLFDNLRSNQRMAPLFNLNELYASNYKLYVYESFYQDMVDALPTNQQNR